jgi:hypothetical protein
MTFWTHEGNLYVQVGQFEVYMLETNGFETPEGWTWQAMPWSYFSEKRYTHVKPISKEKTCITCNGTGLVPREL